MQKVFIISACSESFEIDVCRSLALNNILPISPKLYFPNFLMELCNSEIDIRKEMEICLLKTCDYLYVFIDKDLNNHMNFIIKKAKELNIPWKYIERHQI